MRGIWRVSLRPSCLSHQAAVQGPAWQAEALLAKPSQVEAWVAERLWQILLGRTNLMGSLLSVSEGADSPS